MFFDYDITNEIVKIKVLFIKELMNLRALYTLNNKINNEEAIQFFDVDSFYNNEQTVFVNKSQLYSVLY